jgi:hypothetical protein
MPLLLLLRYYYNLYANVAQKYTMRFFFVVGQERIIGTQREGELFEVSQ